MTALRKGPPNDQVAKSILHRWVDEDVMGVMDDGRSHTIGDLAMRTGWTIDKVEASIKRLAGISAVRMSDHVSCPLLGDRIPRYVSLFAVGED